LAINLDLGHKFVNGPHETTIKLRGRHASTLSNCNRIEVGGTIFAVQGSAPRGEDPGSNLGRLAGDEGLGRGWVAEKARMVWEAELGRAEDNDPGCHWLGSMPPSPPGDGFLFFA